MNKQEILDLFVEQFQKELELLIQAAMFAKEAATDPESLAEDKYDTRGLEQAYLAGAQAKRAAELKESIHHLKNLELQNFDSGMPIDVSALLELEDDDGEIKTFFILPMRGGAKVKYKEREIFSLSPESPLAQALFEKSSGDSVEVNLGGVIQSYFIQSVY